MQTARTDLDEPRPGFAKRAENFGQVCEDARGWSWQPGQTIGRIMDAVLVGALDLSIADRALLALYASHLNQDRLEQGDACVWPSAELMRRRIKCSLRTARAARARLERLGYMVRDYNRANRPAGTEAFDLRPLLAKLEMLEAADDQLRADFAAERAAQYETTSGLHDRDDVEPIYAARAAKSRLLEQSQSKNKYSVQNTDAQKARTQIEVPRAARADTQTDYDFRSHTSPSQTDSANCSPKGANGNFEPRPTTSSVVETVREELEMAFQVCPRIFSVLPERLKTRPSSATRVDIDELSRQLGALLPDSNRNNHLTVAWGWAKHGARVLAMLAIALEDPGVADAGRYFGGMARHDPGDSLDLRMNLRRLLAVRAADPRAGQVLAPERAVVPPPPGVDDPVWVALHPVLEKLVGTGAFGSWFAMVGFGGIDGGVLALTTPTAIAADRIKSQFTDHVLEACRRIDLAVVRVMVTVREKPYGV